jgi:tryptophan halogenase
MNDRVRQVVIVGGGSAGWIAAGRIAAAHRPEGENGIQVTLVESETIGTIGVGEGTWPTMRNTLRKIGISETEFFRSCDAAFKQGARFAGWVTGEPGDAYYHPLNPPQAATQINLSAHWLRRQDGAGTDFAHAVDFQSALCDAGLAPKSISTAEYVGLANYAYHLDAVKFAALLKKHCTEKLGVRHVIDDVTDVKVDEAGFVTGVEAKATGLIEGDFFVDCTGFAALLIGQTYGVPFVDCGDVLLADHAVALQVPYEHEDDPVASQTNSTAQGAGWIWDIGLPTRRGTGYVYSSRHTSHDEAEATLRAYLGPVAEGLNTRRIPIRSGHRQRFWEKNCVAVGLANGFLEPLEASALMLIETAVDFITERLPQSRAVMAPLARQFNAAFDHHWARIIDFLKLHYVLTKRDDTAFWRDNRDPATVPDRLLEQLELWRHLPPGPQDFPHQPEVFSWPSYQYVLHGMGFECNLSEGSQVAAEVALAQRCFMATQRQQEQALAALPSHRALLDAVRVHGFQVV